MKVSEARLHSLDALRAAMMILGIILHGIVSYGTLPHGSGWPMAFGDYSPSTSWPYHDPQGLVFFDYLYDFIHFFRMPLFFLLSGFFTHLVFVKKGTREFIRGRIKRIAYPLLVFWPILFALVGGGMLFLMGGFENGEFKQTAFVNQGNASSVLSPLHLWFLYYLLYYYGAFLLLEKIFKLFPEFERRSLQIFNWCFQSFASVFFFSLPLTVFLFLNHGKVSAASNFIPDPAAMLNYFIFFLFGRYLHQSRILLPRFEKQIYLHLAGGFILLGYLETFSSLNGNGILLQRSFISALCVWCFIFSFLGIFLKLLSAPSAKINYLAESSYWLYLMHLPLIIWLVYAFKKVNILSPIKATLVLFIAFTVLLLSYHWLVRKTFIGRFLNGSKANS